MTRLKELLKHVLSNTSNVFLRGAMIAILLMASAQLEFHFEKGILERADIKVNGTWMQPFIPLNWFKFPFGSPRPAVGTKVPKRLTSK